MCEEIFAEGNYNFELFNYCLEKVFEEQRKEKEEEERRLEAERPKVSFFQNVKNSKFYIFVTFAIIVFSMGLLATNYMNYLPKGTNI
jgi:phage antirepressor YoqD-like protein